MQLATLALKNNLTSAPCYINGTHLSTPSAAVATFLKEPGKKRKKKPGHKGSRRPIPIVNRHETHRLKCCPDCGTELNKRKQTRKRIIEDIPAHITPEVTEHTIHRDYCPKCKKIVEPVVRDAMRLRGRRDSLTVAKYKSLYAAISKRLTKLMEASWQNVQAQRLVKRLRRHREELFVFLYNDTVPSDNNHAERVIRNGVVMRKNSYCNRSAGGAKTQAILMSVFQTLKQHGFQRTDVVVDALLQYLANKKMPALQKTLQTAE
jgi:uncharacterized protein with PIN domain